MRVESQMSTATQEERILEVAKELFTQRGFSNVAVRDICKAADVTPPTVYYYFRNKEALFDAVVRKSVGMTEFISRLSVACEKANDPKSQVLAFTRSYLANFPKDHLNVGLYVRHSTEELDSIGRKTLAADLARIQTILSAIVKNGIAAGQFRKTDPTMAAECLLGMMNRFVFQQIHFRRSYKPAEAASYLTDFFLRAMKTP
jgi:AcrR family transcriptional regulator